MLLEIFCGQCSTSCMCVAVYIRDFKIYIGPVIGHLFQLWIMLSSLPGNIQSKNKNSMPNRVKYVIVSLDVFDNVTGWRDIFFYVHIKPNKCTLEESELFLLRLKKSDISYILSRLWNMKSSIFGHDTLAFLPPRRGLYTGYSLFLNTPMWNYWLSGHYHSWDADKCCKKKKTILCTPCIYF